MNGNPGKQLRQEGAIKRTEAQLAIYEQKIVNDKDNRDLKKKIERAKTTVENTKKNMKQPKHSQVGKVVWRQWNVRDRKLGVTHPYKDSEVGMLCARVAIKSLSFKR